MSLFQDMLLNITSCDGDSSETLTREINDNPSLLKEVDEVNGRSLLHTAIAIKVDLQQDPQKVEAQANYRRQIIDALITAIKMNGYFYQYLFNRQDSEGNTPLHLAMAVADYKTAEDLANTGVLKLSLVRQIDNQPAYALGFMSAERPTNELLGKLLPLDITFAALRTLILDFDESLITALPRVLVNNPKLLYQQDPETQQTLLHTIIASKINDANKKPLQTALIASLITAIQKSTWVYYHPLTLTDAQGNTPLHIAMSSGNAEVAQALIKTEKFDKESANSAGKTIYAMALEQGICTEHLETLKPAAVKTAEISLTTVMQKMQDCDDAALALLERAIKENPAIINEQASTKETLLSSAIKLAVVGDEKTSLRAFLISTIINAIKETTYTPYFSNHPFILKDQDGNTPLHLTIIHKDRITREILRVLDHVDLAAVNTAGDTAFALACRPEAFIDIASRALLNPEKTVPILTSETTSASWYSSFNFQALRSQVDVSVPQSNMLDDTTSVEDLKPSVEQGNPVPAERMMESLDPGNEQNDSIAQPQESQQQIQHPQIQQPQKTPTRPRKLPAEVSAAFDYINTVSAQTVHSAIRLLRFKKTILALGQYALQLKDTANSAETAPLTQAAQEAYDILPQELKSTSLQDHLKVLADEFFWDIRLPKTEALMLGRENFPPVFTYQEKRQQLREKFSYGLIIDQELIQKLQTLAAVLDEMSQQNPDNPALMQIVDSITDLIQTLERGDAASKAIAAGTFSNQVIPAILALEKQEDSWSLREIFMSILNWFYEHKTIEKVVIAPVANPINPWQAYQLSACRKAIATHTELKFASPKVSA